MYERLRPVDEPTEIRYLGGFRGEKEQENEGEIATLLHPKLASHRTSTFRTLQIGQDRTWIVLHPVVCASLRTRSLASLPSSKTWSCR